MVVWIGFAFAQVHDSFGMALSELEPQYSHSVGKLHRPAV